MIKKALTDNKIATSIPNAGLVLLSPYLPQLFHKLQFTSAGKFTDTAACIRAMFVMQYAVFGTTGFPEHEMALNKILAGYKAGLPIPFSIDLTEDEKNTINEMLSAVITNWGKLNTASIPGLQQTFLQREGKLEELKDTCSLKIKRKVIDRLVEELPWAFETIKYSWMEKPLHVKWHEK